MLQDLKRDVLNGKLPVSQALAMALPEFRGKISDDKMSWFVNELQGYPKALDFYQYPKEFPPYRIVPGQLKLIQPDGNLMDVQTQLAKRDSFFLAAPVAWLEESNDMPSDPTMVEMAELGTHLGGSGAGVVVCVVYKKKIQHILDVLKQSLLVFIDSADSA